MSDDWSQYPNRIRQSTIRIRAGPGLFTLMSYANPNTYTWLDTSITYSSSVKKWTEAVCPHFPLPMIPQTVNERGAVVRKARSHM